MVDLALAGSTQTTVPAKERTLKAAGSGSPVLSFWWFPDCGIGGPHFTYRNFLKKKLLILTAASIPAATSVAALTWTQPDMCWTKQTWQSAQRAVCSTLQHVCKYISQVGNTAQCVSITLCYSRPLTYTEHTLSLKNGVLLSALSILIFYIFYRYYSKIGGKEKGTAIFHPQVQDSHHHMTYPKWLDSTVQHALHMALTQKLLDTNTVRLQTNRVS